MMRLFQPRAHRFELGTLESKVMEILWALGESNVREVSDRLERPLAYTTVMTTLDRLFKKGLLERRKEERAFLYSASLTRAEWESARAGNLLANLLDRTGQSNDLLISCLVDAVGARDSALLDELEEKIRQKRMELQVEAEERRNP